MRCGRLVPFLVAFLPAFGCVIDPASTDAASAERRSPSAIGLTGATASADPNAPTLVSPPDLAALPSPAVKLVFTCVTAGETLALYVGPEASFPPASPIDVLCPPAGNGEHTLSSVTPGVVQLWRVERTAPVGGVSTTFVSPTWSFVVDTSFVARGFTQRTDFQFERGHRERTLIFADQVTLGFEEAPFWSETFDNGLGRFDDESTNCPACVTAVAGEGVMRLTDPGDNAVAIATGALQSGGSLPAGDKRVEFDIRRPASDTGDAMFFFVNTNQSKSLEVVWQHGCPTGSLCGQFVCQPNGFGDTAIAPFGQDWHHVIIEPTGLGVGRVFVGEVVTAAPLIMLTAADEIAFATFRDRLFDDDALTFDVDNVHVYARAESGTYLSPPVDFADRPSGALQWGQLLWNANVPEPSIQQVTVQVLYAASSGAQETWEVLEAPALPRPSGAASDAPFETSPIDLTAINPRRYPRLRFAARIAAIRDDTLQLPVLDDWTLTWKGPCFGSVNGEPCDDRQVCTEATCVGEVCTPDPMQNCGAASIDWDPAPAAEVAAGVATRFGVVALTSAAVRTPAPAADLCIEVVVPDGAAMPTLELVEGSESAASCSCSFCGSVEPSTGRLVLDLTSRSSGIVAVVARSLSATVDGELRASITVNAGVAAHLALRPPSDPVPACTEALVYLELEDAYDNLTSVSAPLEVTVSTSSPGAVLSGTTLEDATAAGGTTITGGLLSRAVVRVRRETAGEDQVGAASSGANLEIGGPVTVLFAPAAWDPQATSVRAVTELVAGRTSQLWIDLCDTCEKPLGGQSPTVEASSGDIGDLTETDTPGRYAAPITVPFGYCDDVSVRVGLEHREIERTLDLTCPAVDGGDPQGCAAATASSPWLLMAVAGLLARCAARRRRQAVRASRDALKPPWR